MDKISDYIVTLVISLFGIATVLYIANQQLSQEKRLKRIVQKEINSKKCLEQKDYSKATLKINLRFKNKIVVLKSTINVNNLIEDLENKKIGYVIKELIKKSEDIVFPKNIEKQTELLNEFNDYIKKELNNNEIVSSFETFK